ncbi:hypothetical protein K503DRAFT_804725 [Rhizopogon vinicolor AM-OR11-026]|uniref:Uncharacterized protein n=1 Tax=Rhizopogon vinicolor AM-OR11-026 TaxID=1314800 RepID=A0A1B7MKA1_9AGAM|nr:hypothetical protein K503DRAFT_804725 [Rhizopogon vinicolor AM-OR11-026]
MTGYPEDTLMPGELHVTLARSKGISDLDKREQHVLADAMRSGQLIIKREKQTDFNTQRCPVVIGEAPPPASMHSRGRRMLVDGTIDHEGLSRLQQSVAATKVKVSKPSTSKNTASHALPSIDIQDRGPSSSHTDIHKQKLLPVIELPVRPPARIFDPSKVVKAPSSKRRLKRPAPQAVAPAREVISIDMSSEAQVSSDDSEVEFEEDEPLEAVDSESKYDDTMPSRKRKKKDIKGKGKAAEQDAHMEKRVAGGKVKVVQYLSTTAESYPKQGSITEHRPLHLCDDPETPLPAQKSTQYDDYSSTIGSCTPDSADLRRETPTTGPGPGRL